MASESGEEKGSARLNMIRQIIQKAEERDRVANSGPTPKITLGIIDIICGFISANKDELTVMSNDFNSRLKTHKMGDLFFFWTQHVK
jgi:hypothetical protein